MLLDLRLLLLEVESLEQLLEEPAAHARRVAAPSPLRYTRVRMADEVSPPYRARKRRQQRRRVVARRPRVVVLLIVAAAGVFVATPATTPTQAQRRSRRPPRRSRTRSGISATYASAPMRNAVTKGGDVAVYASPDPNAQPSHDAEPADRVPAAAQLPRVRPVPGLAARLPADAAQRRDRLDQGVRRHRLEAARVPDQGHARRPQALAAEERRRAVRRAGARPAPATPHADRHLLLHRPARPAHATGHRVRRVRHRAVGTQQRAQSSPAATARSRSTAPTTPAPSVRACRTAASASTTSVILKLSTLPLGTPVVIT